MIVFLNDDNLLSYAFTKDECNADSVYSSSQQREKFILAKTRHSLNEFFDSKKYAIYDVCNEGWAPETAIEFKDDTDTRQAFFLLRNGLELPGHVARTPSSRCPCCEFV
jgi:hypothetical protein